MARNVFYSFHYLVDAFRVSQVRNMGVIEGNQSIRDNDWETVKKGGDAAIQKWIDDQLQGRSCAVVLIGKDTYGRKWINYEIQKAWASGKGVVGIHIHNLKDSGGNQTTKGVNPFSYFNINGTPFNNIVKAYDPPHWDSKEVYAHIKANIEHWIEEAIAIRGKY
ncbi:TIR domain-containing protein [Bdellovibrio sp. GT3]|uniref:TIR domain-containing protein n=1 Tax=Bdellovibrio sp. GT3 TaxID=3136282 RepID=UPI0030F01BA5